MKKVLILSAFALVMNFGVLSAKEAKPKKNHAAMKQEISNLLTPFQEIEELEEDVTVKVKVMMTPKHQIVVLKTNASDEGMDTYIKESLNYKMLESADLQAGEDYVFTVTFRAE
ncbi:hypothetical protein FFWV33_09190 [Flavobacterium faecale]|uniref:TonB C-terminal domain-containing protein n=1 Tax=Flavobacterium faecale TaxID=1355330 RepID=A0A2S1LD70_9FLAO|nr:hypothetical protein [Flavobacterium faecale]AWG21700.1 hypothetical protein FFWV33_09190 [Flavobacterium faecale]